MIQSSRRTGAGWSFVRSAAAIRDLYVLDLQRGGDPRLLIESDFLEDQAAFSPDGKSIFFVSTFSGNADIYLLPFRPDRTLSMKQAENLTHHPGADLPSGDFPGRPRDGV